MIRILMDEDEGYKRHGMKPAHIIRQININTHLILCNAESTGYFGLR